MQSRIRLLFTAVTTSVLLVACGGGGNSASAPAPAASAPAPAPYPVGLTDQTLTWGGVVRQFRVHVPVTVAQGAAPRALVFVLHGGGGEGMGVADTGVHPMSVFRTVADREDFVVVYPGGLPAQNGDVGWNDCRSDNLVGSTADDVGFLADLVERARTQYSLPNTRVFMTGGSNGGLMTYSFALYRADLIAAAATSSANVPLNPKPGPCAGNPSRPLPMLMTHGTLDPQMPYTGGCVSNLGGACNRGRVISAEATRERWLQINALMGVTPAQSVIEIEPNDGGPANRFTYLGPNPVQWWRLDGAGHTAASRAVRVSPSPVTGVQNNDIEFAEVAWAFFAARLP